jgi:hypothetical protein
MDKSKGDLAESLIPFAAFSRESLRGPRIIGILALKPGS